MRTKRPVSVYIQIIIMDYNETDWQAILLLILLLLQIGPDVITTYEYDENFSCKNVVWLLILMQTDRMDGQKFMVYTHIYTLFTVLLIIILYSCK